MSTITLNTTDEAYTVLRGLRALDFAREAALLAVEHGLPAADVLGHLKTALGAAGAAEQKQGTLGATGSH